MEDLIEVVRKQVASALAESVPEAEGFRYSVTWKDIQAPDGTVIQWVILLTVPSVMVGQVPLAITLRTDGTRSLPDPLQVKAMVTAGIPMLRKARNAEKLSAAAEGAALLGRLQ